VIALSIEETLTHGAGYIRAGEILADKGFLCACIDAPAHGKDILPGESGDSSEALTNWRKRVENGHTLVPEFASKASSVIDYLIETGQTDPSKIAVCGTSRGGFLALHVAAADPRMKCVAAFAPVTDLLALREFGGMEKDKITNQLALRNVAGKLADRPVWIAIGNNDTRVGTDFAVELARKIAQEAVARKAQPLVELHVVAAAGHALHETAHEEAAEWIAVNLKP
jgi:dienelactone hydrolase